MRRKWEQFAREGWIKWVCRLRLGGKIQTTQRGLARPCSGHLLSEMRSLAVASKEGANLAAVAITLLSTSNDSLQWKDMLAIDVALRSVYMDNTVQLNTASSPHPSAFHAFGGSSTGTLFER